MNEQDKSRNDAAVQVKGIGMCFEVSSPGIIGMLAGRKGKTLRAVDEVTLDIAAGETLALVGESGCGKSTFARVLAGLYSPTSGSVSIFGIDPKNADEAQKRELRRRVNMIFQDPYASLNPRWNIYDIVAEPLRVQNPEMPESEISERVASVMSMVRLPAEALQKYPHQFSGGQRQRISIARALASRPDFLICDEPTSALDVSVQAQVLNLMKDIQRQCGITYLFISHNLAVVHHMSDRIGVMYLGRVVELADKTELFEKPLHPYTGMLLAAIPHIRETGKTRIPVAGEVPSPLDPPSGCTFHPRCPLCTEKCRREIPEFRKVTFNGRERFVACHHASCG